MIVRLSRVENVTALDELNFVWSAKTYTFVHLLIACFLTCASSKSGVVKPSFSLIALTPKNPASNLNLEMKSNVYEPV